MLLVAMLAIMVLIAAAMAKDNHNKNNDNHFVRNFDRFDNNRFDNGFQDFEQEADSGDVERSITAEEVVKTLATLFAHRGEPAFIRSDNGPEFVAKAVKRWLEVSGVNPLHR